MPIKKIKLETIIIDAGTDVRNEINEDTVNEYGQHAREKAKLPPLIVFDSPDGLLLADGFHRYFGFERQGIKEYECEIRKGSRADAIKFALGCNTTHGLRRTNADKRNAVVIALKEFPSLSNRSIREMCNVSLDLVGDVRRDIEAAEDNKPKVESGSGDENEPQQTPPPRKIQGKDGKTYSSKIPPRKQEHAQPQKNNTMDATGIQVPEEVVDYWDMSFAESQRLLNFISEIRTRIKAAQDRNEPMFREVDHTDCVAKLDQVYAEVKRVKPYAVCPECNGVMRYAGKLKSKATGEALADTPCPSCKGRGFVSEFFWKNCVAEQKKKVTGRA